MLWTYLWFAHQKQVWEERRDKAFMSLTDGHRVYAAKQVGIWSEFLNSASEEFSDILEQMKLQCQ